MKRGEIYFADLGASATASAATIGEENRKVRPVLIVSNDANNAAASVLTVVPITSDVAKVYPFEVLLEIEGSGLKKRAKVQCNLVRTVAKARMSIGSPAGGVSEKIMAEIEHAIKLHLDLL